MRQSTCVCFLVVVCLAAGAASAATFTVTNANASGPGSLPDAVTQANAVAGPHTINITASGTAVLTTPLVLTQAMTINGPTAAPPSYILDGGRTTRLIQLSPSASGAMTLNYLTLTHGQVDSAKGGAVAVPAGRTLTLSHCLVTANATTGTSGADVLLSAGGAVSVLGTLNVQSSTFSDNSSSGPAGAIYAGPASTVTITASLFTGNQALSAWAGAMYGDSTAMTTITDSTFTYNRSGSGGSGALAFTNSKAVIRGSTISNNTTKGAGGAMVTNSAAGGSIGIENSTLSENSANHGGAVYAQLGTADFRNVTITNNAATIYAGGIENPGSTVVSLRNSIVAGNTSTSSSPDCSGVMASAGFNLFGNIGGCNGLVASDRTVPSPALSGLADNGGPTRTHLPFKGSLAIDGGNPAGCLGLSGQPLLVDQRGQPRPFGSACDIGSVEMVTNTPAAAKRRVSGHP